MHLCSKLKSATLRLQSATPRSARLSFASAALSFFLAFASLLDSGFCFGGIVDRFIR
jgi:hypothetical protein